MHRSARFVASAVISMSLVASSTAAVASASTAASANGWLALSMLSPSGAAVLGGTGAAAAQPETPPPPPPPPQYEGGIGTPPIPVILIWLAVLGVDIYILTKNDHHPRIPNSPA
jgi:hypothetical protein